MLVQLIYISTPVPGLIDKVNSDLARFQNRNKVNGVAGMILSHEKFFLQLLEGERDAVNAMFRKISTDNRHTHVTIVRYADIRKPEFADWTHAVIDTADTLVHDTCIEFLMRHYPNLDLISEEITSAIAMSVIRKTVMVVTLEHAPNRRATDIETIFSIADE